MNDGGTSGGLLGCGAARDRGEAEGGGEEAGAVGEPVCQLVSAKLYGEFPVTFRTTDQNSYSS